MQLEMSQFCEHCGREVGLRLQRPSWPCQHCERWICSQCLSEYEYDTEDGSIAVCCRCYTASA